MAAIAQTAASVLAVTTSGITNVALNTGIAAAGVTIVAGNMVYLVDAAAQTYGLADANVSGAKVPVGMAQCGCGPGQPFFFLSRGTINPGGTMTVGVPIYLSVTPGGITETYADIASGEWSVVIGQAIAATTLNIDLTGQAIAKP